METTKRQCIRCLRAFDESDDETLCSRCQAAGEAVMKSAPQRNSERFPVVGLRLDPDLLADWREIIARYFPGGEIGRSLAVNMAMMDASKLRGGFYDKAFGNRAERFLQEEDDAIRTLITQTVCGALAAFGHAVTVSVLTNGSVVVLVDGQPLELPPVLLSPAAPEAEA